MRFKKSLVLAAAALMVLGITTNAQGDLIAHWNFNTPTWTGSKVPGAGGSPTSFASVEPSDSAVLNLSTWTALIASNVSDPLNQNAVSPEPAGNALYFVSSAGNGQSVQFTNVNLTNKKNPILTFITARGTNGYTTQTWAWSTDGINYNAIAGNTAAPNATFLVRTIDLTGVAGLENKPNVRFRVTFTGATTATGNNRIDNFQINASIPEPGSIGLASLLMVGTVVARRRRK